MKKVGLDADIDPSENQRMMASATKRPLTAAEVGCFGMWFDARHNMEGAASPTNRRTVPSPPATYEFGSSRRPGVTVRGRMVT
eukprot:5188118-Pyramimonas_sp.AAC.1